MGQAGWETVQADPRKVSAGYDAAAGDPLGENKVSPVGYAQMTKLLQTLADGRVVVSLEVGL